MQYTLKGESPFPVAVVRLDAGQSVQIESGAMIYHNGRIALAGKMNSNGKTGLGGLMSAIGRSMTSGESFFITTATSTADAGEIAIAPSNPGPITALPVDATHQWRLNTGAFLAADSTASYQMVSQSAGRALFGGTGGFFIMESQGEGEMLISAYGDLIPLDLVDQPGLPHRGGQRDVWVHHWRGSGQPLRRHRPRLPADAQRRGPGRHDQALHSNQNGLSGGF